MPLLFRCGHTATSMIPSIDPCKQKLLLFKNWPIQWALALKMAEMRESSISPGLELNNGAASRNFAEAILTSIMAEFCSPSVT
ncbi:hypothetical protein NC652_003939 [Populus alba x Populus x berolinensis]|nr:hypothetical protein NC652_003939 [Populus alba x Populus x berolinensis]